MADQQLVSVDLSKHMITHMNRELTANISNVEKLNLDQNSISKLENLSHLSRLQQLSAGHNCLIKISGIENLRNLTVLNLPENSICAIEGISTLTQLIWLNLSGNNIRQMTGLNNNLSLKHIDLSDNTITSLSDLSYLYTLKTLLLHGNIIRSLADAGKLLPRNLSILSLAENEISDLYQVRNLVPLKKLEQLSLMNNPCVSYQHMTHHSAPYRAYVLSWACNLEVLDGMHVTVTERQNASELLSSGAAHKFGPAEQPKLMNYLASITFKSLADTVITRDKQVDERPQAVLERPSTAHGKEYSQSPSGTGQTVRRTKSDDRLSSFQAQSALNPNSDQPPIFEDTQTSSVSGKPVKAQTHASRHAGVDSPSASPLVSRKDMQGLIRQVIGQERSPSATSNLRTPKQSAALPKMSRSRSASRSPTRNEQRTPAIRKLILDSTNDVGQSGIFTPQSEAQSKLPTDTANQLPECQPMSHLTVPSTYTDRHHKSAVQIQSLWRGYRSRNLDPIVHKVKQEIRCRRIEETLAFLITEMNRQQQINKEELKLRHCMITSIEHLAKKLEDMTSHSYMDASAV